MLASGIRLRYRVAMRLSPKHLLPVAALLAPLLALAPFTAAAQAVRAEAIPESVLRPYSMRQAPDTQTAMPLPDVADPEPVDDGRAPRDYSMMQGSVQVLEQPRDPVTGAWRRPKIIVGLPSNAMKSWLKAGGITAERCLLPMVWARAKLSDDGEASGSLWLYARCTFQ